MAVRTGWIERMTWADAGAGMRAGIPVVLPVGAAAKAHGPHLPLGTDRIVVEALAERLAARLPLLIAPTVGFGYYPAFVEFPASQHIPAPLFQALLDALMRRFVEAGARRLLILNNGVSTEGPIAIAAHTLYAETGVRPAIAHLRLFGAAADAVLTDPTGGHADERETSVMLALRPDLVDLSALDPAAPAKPPPPAAAVGGRFVRPVRLANARPPEPGEASASGATGDPRQATAAKGEIVLAAIMDELLAEARRVFPPGDAAGEAD